MRKKVITIFCLWTITVNYPCKTAVALGSHNRHLAFCCMQSCDAIYFKPAQTTRLLSNIGRISDSFWTSISDCFVILGGFCHNSKFKEYFLLLNHLQLTLALSFFLRGQVNHVIMMTLSIGCLSSVWLISWRERICALFSFHWSNRFSSALVFIQLHTLTVWTICLNHVLFFD